MGHVITRSRTTTDGVKIVFGRPYPAIVDIYIIDGPVVAVGITARLTTLAECKERIRSSMGADMVSECQYAGDPHVGGRVLPPFRDEKSGNGAQPEICPYPHPQINSSSQLEPAPRGGLFLCPAGNQTGTAREARRERARTGIVAERGRSRPNEDDRPPSAYGLKSKGLPRMIIPSTR